MSDSTSTTNEKIERIVLRILISKKAVKTIKQLIFYALDKAAEEKLTVSEKTLKIAIEQMEKDKKIQFSQKDGWKIHI